MSADPTAYIREAFESVRIEVCHLVVTDYSPSSFGNFICYAETGVGRLRITYDRQFEIEILDGKDQPLGGLVSALDEAKRRSGL